MEVNKCSKHGVGVGPDICTCDNWWEQFDKQFLDSKVLSRGQRYFWKEVWDGGDHMVRDPNPDKIKAFIQSLLEAQKSELLEKITLKEKEPNYPLDDSVEAKQVAREYLGYNQAVSDLEALKATLESLPCYCQCHNPASSCPGCEHCKAEPPIEGKDENPPEPEDEVT